MLVLVPRQGTKVLSLRALWCPAEELNWGNSLGFILYAAVNK